MAARTGFAVFDSDGRLLETNQAFLDLIEDKSMRPDDLRGRDCLTVLGEVFASFDRLAGAALPRPEYEDGDGNLAIGALTQHWAALDEGPVEARGTDGRWHLLTSHPRPGGGTAFIAVDISERKRIEEEQRAADDLFRLITDRHPLPVWVADMETGEIIYESLSASNMLGRSWDPDRPQFITDHYAHAEDRETVKRLMETRESLFDYEVEFKRGDGGTIWISANVRRGDYLGRPVFVSGIADITMRRQREQELGRARELLIDAIESLTEGFALYDRDERLVMCNSRYREMNEPHPEAIEIGKTWSEIVMDCVRAGLFPAAIGREDEWLAEQRGELDSQPYSREMLQSNGRWYAASRTPTREGGFVITRIDVTERTQIEEAQRRADAVVRQVLDACPSTIQMTSTDGRILYRTPAAMAMFGDVKSSSEYYADPKQREDYVKRLRQTRAVDDLEVDLIRANGEIMRAAISSRMIEFQGEEVIVSHSFDLTDRIALQEEVGRQRESLHQSEKLKALGELLAGVAHELNNPLSVVVGQSLLLKETADDEATRKRAEKIGNAADRCARIVKTFLAMARQRPAEMVNASVNDMLQGALEMAGYAIRASGIELTLSLSPDLPAIWCDPDQLSQVFINLLVNAEQALQEAAEPRRIRVISRPDRRRGQVVVEVVDNGPGIAEEIRSRIFEPFFTTKEVGTGTGIGLAFCHRIVEAQGGSISVSESPDSGSTFTVRLPASGDAQRQSESGQDRSAAVDGLAALIVDDETDVAEFISEVLRHDGFDVTHASSGQQAMAELRERPFEVVLSDLKMPGMDGPQLFDEMKIHCPDRVARLGFMTGDTMSPSARAFLEASGRPFLEKPIRPAELRDFVSRLREDAAG